MFFKSSGLAQSWHKASLINLKSLGLAQIQFNLLKKSRFSLTYTKLIQG